MQLKLKTDSHEQNFTDFGKKEGKHPENKMESTQNFCHIFSRATTLSSYAQTSAPFHVPTDSFHDRRHEPPCGQMCP